MVIDLLPISLQSQVESVPTLPLGGRSGKGRDAEAPSTAASSPVAGEVLASCSFSRATCQAHRNPNTALRAAFEQENPGLRYDDYKNRLGKLTLLEKPINIVVANSCFAAKKDVYAKSGNYLTRSLCGLTTVGNNTSINRINTLLKPFHQWPAKAIDERREVLETIAADVWSTKVLSSRYAAAQATLESLADMICGHALVPHRATEATPAESNFLYRSSTYLTRFFEDCELSYVHNGSTRKWWVMGVLGELNDEASAPDLPSASLIRVMQELMDRENFKDEQQRSAALDDLNTALGSEVVPLVRTVFPLR